MAFFTKESLLTTYAYLYLVMEKHGMLDNADVGCNQGMALTPQRPVVARHDLQTTTASSYRVRVVEDRKKPADLKVLENFVDTLQKQQPIGHCGSTSGSSGNKSSYLDAPSTSKPTESTSATSNDSSAFLKTKQVAHEANPRSVGLLGVKLIPMNAEQPGFNKHTASVMQDEKPFSVGALLHPRPAPKPDLAPNAAKTPLPNDKRQHCPVKVSSKEPLKNDIRASITKQLNEKKRLESENEDARRRREAAKRVSRNKTRRLERVLEETKNPVLISARDVYLAKRTQREKMQEVLGQQLEVAPLPNRSSGNPPAKRGPNDTQRMESLLQTSLDRNNMAHLNITRAYPLSGNKQRLLSVPKLTEQKVLREAKREICRARLEKRP